MCARQRDGVAGDAAHLRLGLISRLIAARRSAGVDTDRPAECCRGRAEPPPNPLRGSGLTPKEWSRAASERDKVFEAVLVFIDWRHKVMVRFMVMVAALLAAWKHVDGEDRALLELVVLAIGAGGSVTFALMDRVNEKQMTRLYERGAYWERLMYDGVGVHGAIRHNGVDADRWRATPMTTGDSPPPARTLSYTRILRWTYSVTGAVFAVSAVLQIPAL